MKNIFLTIAFLFTIIVDAQQSQHKDPCGTDAIMKNLIANFPETRLRINEFEKRIQHHRNENNKIALTPAPNSITIPVVVYIVHDGTSVTNISDNQVNDQITALNNYFHDTGVRFCIATKLNSATIPTVNTTDVQTTSGIIHVNNPTLSNHFSNSPQALVNTADPSVVKDRYLRIWVVKSIDGSGSGILGYSMFPNTSSVFDGVVMRYDVFGNANNNMLTNYNLGKVLVHEIGHYLGLYHTFEGACSTPNSDCSLDGDYVCDTPSVASPNFDCTIGTDSCVDSNNSLDDISNYMDYGNNICQTHFTAGQIERMYTVLTLNRSQLFSHDNIIFTGTCGYTSLLSATITCSDFSPCTNPSSSVAFSALNAQSYQWDFGDPFSSISNPNTATTQNASHFYSSSANSPYTVTLTVHDSNGNTSISSELIYVTDCTPITGSNAFWYIDSSYGINFSSGKPIFDNNFPSNNYANLSCNSQCDANGNLLFYTNKFKVWNNQNIQINASDLMLNSSFNNSNQVLVIPEPPLSGNNISKYFILTQQGANEATSDIGFRKSTINIAGTNTTMGQIAQPITLPSSYGFNTNADGSLLGAYCITAVQKCNSNDYWIITVLLKGTLPYFVVFSLTNSGLAYNSERKITDQFGAYGSILKMSSNGNKLYFGYTFTGNIYDFNKAEGIISSNYSSISIPDTGISGSTQIEDAIFSPDSNLLYVTSYFSKNIYQFNINSINVQNSRREVASTLENNWILSLGPDKKIYIGTTVDGSNTQKLSVIHFPNRISTTISPNDCGFSNKGPKPAFVNYSVGPGLPNCIYAKSDTAYFTANDANVICKYIVDCNSYKFFPNICGTSFIWTFTNTTTGISVTATDTDPIYTFSQNGSYIVTLKDNNNVLLGTSSPIIISNLNTINIVGSQNACLTQQNKNITNNSAVLQNGDSIVWSVASGSGTITGPNNQSSVNVNWMSLPGSIVATIINNSGCTTSANITITSLCSLGNDIYTEDNITITPNPSSGRFIINTSLNYDKVQIRVYDAIGKCILQKNDIDLSKENAIDLSNNRSGIYFISIYNSNLDYSKKIIKKEN